MNRLHHTHISNPKSINHYQNKGHWVTYFWEDFLEVLCHNHWWEGNLAVRFLSLENIHNLWPSNFLPRNPI